MFDPGDEDWRWRLGCFMDGIMPWLCALIILIAGALGGQ